MPRSGRCLSTLVCSCRATWRLGRRLESRIEEVTAAGANDISTGGMFSARIPFWARGLVVLGGGGGQVFACTETPRAVPVFLATLGAGRRRGRRQPILGRQRRAQACARRDRATPNRSGGRRRPGWPRPVMSPGPGGVRAPSLFSAVMSALGGPSRPTVPLLHANRDVRRRGFPLRKWIWHHEWASGPMDYGPAAISTASSHGPMYRPLATASRPAMARAAYRAMTGRRTRPVRRGKCRPGGLAVQSTRPRKAAWRDACGLDNAVVCRRASCSQACVAKQRAIPFHRRSNWQCRGKQRPVLWASEAETLLLHVARASRWCPSLCRYML